MPLYRGVVSIDVRPATEADLSTVRQIAQDAYGGYPAAIGVRPMPLDADYAAQISAGEVWVLTIDERVRGFAVLQPRTDHLLLENVAVTPELQGTGLGSRLLATAENHARELGLDQVRLYTNQAMTQNIVFYARRGYRETSRSTEGAWSRVFMTKQFSTDTGSPRSS